MVRALGIDPGTGSFDLVLVERDRVLWEKSIPTVEVARRPELIVEAVREAGGVDIIAGPSGYGSPVICNEDIVDPRTYALNVLLLSSEEDIRSGVSRGETGIMVYKALADVVEAFWRLKLPVCYIPSVILLPTIPFHRKINKVDMGTADKLAVTVLAIYDQSRRLGISYSETDFVLVEMGFGYNAVIRVVDGKIVDGYGGTLTLNGFLTIGFFDGEIVATGREWSRSDVFYGGVSTLCKTLSIDEALRAMDENWLCREGFESMFESILRNIYGTIAVTGKPREIILSGRLTRYERITDMLRDKLEGLAPIVKLRGLNGSVASKEAGQGYAVIAEGLGGGYFRELVDHVELRRARGTVLDYVYHPRMESVKKRVRDALTRSVRDPERFLS